jgi:hypothetical protein
MGARTPLAFAVALLLTPAVATAQVSRGAAQAPGIHITVPPKPEPPAQPGPLPVPTPHHQGRFDRAPDPVPGEDVFRAGPGTYRPRKQSFPYMAGGGFYPSGYIATEVIAEPLVVERPVVIERTTVVEVEREPAGREETAAAPSRPFVTAKPRTLYVIPRCYAGDKPPLPERLPAGCDIRNLKEIPPAP